MATMRLKPRGYNGAQSAFADFARRILRVVATDRRVPRCVIPMGALAT